jgi:NAD(P)-dependent dehydrogenase (short-subunit alcohol dehydrogenase family)
VKTLDLSNDVILVTGGSGSIGSAISLELAAAGAAVVVADRDLDAASAVAAQIVEEGGSAASALLDVASSSSVDSVASEAVSRFGRLTGLVNSAGVLRTGDLPSMSDDDWNLMLTVNVSGTFRTTRAVAPYLKRTGRGSIVNLSSVSAFIGSEDGAAYTATKGAVLSFTIGTAGELAPFGIRVNAVCPGWVDGGFTHQAMEQSEDPAALAAYARQLHPLGRMASPRDVANAVVWLMSNDASFVTGTSLFVDGGFMVQRGLNATSKPD